MGRAGKPKGSDMNEIQEQLAEAIARDLRGWRREYYAAGASPSRLRYHPRDRVDLKYGYVSAETLARAEALIQPSSGF